ncbi:hypothetical protein [Phycicoccus sp. Soil748]|uniref:hypothetical protein n=1 Tax=Phycicoccus sp. Soil748 TaxID=1736397 RepID=UPI000702C233|nr:hypothetical protein [Phycicoccus sp. Soil748]KRE53798.1 hypothetical protein ASG70_11930 [Phycicoccus sp. Soil748]
MKKRFAVLLAAPLAVLVSGGAAMAVGASHYDATLRPVPHRHSADGGSQVHGTAVLRLSGRTLDINLKASGLTPNEPHAMHIHGLVDSRNECPDISADVNTGDPIDPSTFVAGKPDGLISLSEGAPSYGPIDVSLTARGDTSPASGLTLERFVKADSRGNLTYHRSVVVPKDIATNLSDLHIVIHGADLPSDKDHSSLSNLFEATLPVACGAINKSS